MNHDKDLDKQLNTTLLRFFDGQLTLSQTRERIKQTVGRSFLDIGQTTVTVRGEEFEITPAEVTINNKKVTYPEVRKKAKA